MYVFEKPFESEKIKYGRNQLQRLWNVTYLKMKDKGPTHDSDRKSTRQPGHDAGKKSCWRSHHALLWCHTAMVFLTVYESPPLEPHQTTPYHCIFQW